MTATASAAVPGDLDGDGAINIKDVTTALQVSVGLRELDAEARAAADVAPRPGLNGRLYGDGRITVADATRILQVAVGLLPMSELSPEEPISLYTLNAGPQCKGPATVSIVDLAQLSEGAGAVTLNAFSVGETPSHMVIEGDTGYIAASGANALQIVDLKTLKVETVDLGEGTNPMQVAVLGGKAYVTLLLTGEVAVVDLMTRQVKARIATGSGATGVLAFQGKVYVTNTAFEGFDPAAGVSKFEQGTVTILDATSDLIIGTLTVPTNPQDMALDTQGRLHVVSVGNYADIPGEVTVFSPNTHSKVGSVLIGGAPGGIAITFKDKAYLADSVNGVTVYDARTLGVLRGPTQAIPASPFPFDVAADSRGRVFVDVLSANKVIVLDSMTDNSIGELTVDACPQALAVR